MTEALVEGLRKKQMNRQCATHEVLLSGSATATTAGVEDGRVVHGDEFWAMVEEKGREMEKRVGELKAQLDSKLKICVGGRRSWRGRRLVLPLCTARETIRLVGCWGGVS